MLTVYMTLCAVSAITLAYEIDYDNTDWPNYKPPFCGDNIELMDVTKNDKINQIRLSFTENPSEMYIMWVTNKVNHINEVKYGPDKSNLNYTAFSFYDQYGWVDDYVSGYIHKALLLNLVPGVAHYYQITSNDKMSDVIEFIVPPGPGDKAPINIFHTGDVGAFGTSVMVTKTMMDRMNEEEFHATVVCGDLSYADELNDERPESGWADQRIWDTYGAMIEPIAKKMGYMGTPGNHEIDVPDSSNENMTSYMRRFTFPGNGRYYGFPLGMVYVISVSTDESVDPSSTQGRWLETRLAYVNENRNQWPWLVLFQHRPIYNSNQNHGNWTGENAWEDDEWEYPEKNGWPTDFEKLLLKYDVDLVLNGHVHHYELTYPIKERNKMVNSYNEEDFRAPIHITCGHGGQKLYKYVWDTKNTVNTYSKPKPAFVAARNNENWGHCELLFKDRDTVQHRMYKMGESAPTEDVLITRKHPINASPSSSLSWTLLLLVTTAKMFCWV